MKKALLATAMAIIVALVVLPGLKKRGEIPSLPAPTEHWLDEDAEKRNNSLRRQWIEEMHLTAPGADWRAMERANGLRLMAERNALMEAGVKKASVVWAELGSRNLAGRMHCATLSAAGDSIYAGSSRGGVWKASLNGEGWRPLSDNLWGGCHGVAVADGPPEKITAITDDGLFHYTADGGNTWIWPTGIPTDLIECKRVLRDLETDNVIYAVVRQSVTSGKVFRSDDGGETYTRIARLLADPGDIWIDRVNGGDLYLLKDTQMLRTSDLGVTWDTLGTIPVSNPADVVLTGSEAGSPTLYAALNLSGNWDLYRSTDGGWSWTYRYRIDDFWETLCASISDPDLVLFAGVEMYRSTNGGSSFTKVNNWADYYGDPEHMLHADFPGTDCLWAGGEIFYIATDGGLYRSDDGVATVNNISLENLAVSQYYSTLTSVNDPDLIVVGSQDQGYQRSYGPAIGSMRNFDQLISGDYGHLTSGDGTHEYVFSVYPGFTLVHWQESYPVLYTIDFPSGENYSWMPYILADPLDRQAFYFCARHIHRYRWHPFTADHTMLPQDFTVNGGSYLTALGISSIDTDQWIAVTNTGKIWYSTDGGGSWSVSPDNGPSSHYFYGTALVWSPNTGPAAYMGGSGYSGPAVYRTDDGGVSWVADSNGLPSTLVYGLTYEQSGSGALYAATDAGPYRRDPVTGVWEYIGGAYAPLTTYWCVEAVPAASVIRFGTYSRGIWDYDYTISTTVAELEEDQVPTPSGIFSYPNPFNPSTTLRYRLEESGPVRIAIYNAAGQEVRLLRNEDSPAGVHEVVWDGTDHRGSPVASGVYMARLEAGGQAKVRRMVLAR